MDTATLLRNARLTPEQAATLTSYTARQWRRFLSGAAPLPVPVRLLLELRAGDLGRLWPEWSGWTIRPGVGEIVSPVGHWYDPDKLIASFWWEQKIQLRNDELERRALALEAENAALRARIEREPTPWRTPGKVLAFMRNENGN